MYIGQVIADSPERAAVLATVRTVADSDAPVVIQGETGTGKSLIAKVIHRESLRKSKPFVPLNCAAVSETLLDSELFGYEKGAFTGAIMQKRGLFEAADGGTLFLDEVSEMSRSMQTKLLQVLDDGEVRRVGGTTLHKADVRILAAAISDMEEEVRAGRFRQDLLFRLKVITLKIPPLRKRREDIPSLVDLYLKRYNRRSGKPPKRASAETVEALCQHSWPGNVRELAHAIERAILLAPGDEIRTRDALPKVKSSRDAGPEEPALPRPLVEVERLAIIRALEYTQGTKAPAARLLGINVKTLSRKIKAYGIQI